MSVYGGSDAFDKMVGQDDDSDVARDATIFVDGSLHVIE